MTIIAIPRPELQRRAARYHKAASELLASLGARTLASRVKASPGATYDIMRAFHVKRCEKMAGVDEVTARFLATVLIP